MISTAPPPSAGASQTDLATSQNSDTMQDVSTPSFASQLDQQLTTRAPQNASGTPASSSSAASTSSVASTSSTTSAQSASSAAPNASSDANAREETSSPQSSLASQDKSASETKGVSTSGSNKKDPGSKTTKSATSDQSPLAASSSSAASAPLLSAALAITNSVALLPVSTLAGTTTAAKSPLDVEADTELLAKSISVSPLPSDATQAGAASLSSLSTLPHNLSGLAMDSRALLPMETPGVANALPLTSSLSATVGKSTLPLKANSVSLDAAPVAGKASGAAFGLSSPAQAAIAANQEASTISQPTDTEASPTIPVSDHLSRHALAAVTPNAMPAIYNTGHASSESTAQTGSLSGSSIVPTAVVPQTAPSLAIKGLEAMEAMEASGNNTMLTSEGSAGNSKATDANMAGGQNLQVGQLVGQLEKLSEAGTQHLEGIERLLTLGTQKTSLSSEVATLSAAQRVLSDSHNVNAGVPSSQSLPSLADPEAILNSVSPTLPMALNTGSIESSIQALQDNPGTAGASSPLPGQPTPGGFALSSLLPAAVTAAGQSSTNDTFGRESQADTPKHGQDEDSAKAAGGANTTIDSARLIANPQQSDAAVFAAVPSAPNGSSLIDRADVVAQVTQHLETMRFANGSGEMQVHLTPENLGNVQISVSTHQDGVVARIVVETAQVQQAMDGAKQHLRSSLEARGLHVDSVEVSVNPSTVGGGMAFTGQRNGNPDNEYAQALPEYRRPSTRRADSAGTALSAPIMLSAARPAASRLDYLA